MRQKETARRTKGKKPAARGQTSTQLLMLADKIEKEFRQIPGKLARLYRQELMTQKQQELKLKAQLKKTEALENAAQKKLETLMKTNAPKKRLVSTRKSREQAAKTMKQLTAQLNQITKNRDTLLVKQNKYTALNRELGKLEKQLTLQVLTKTKPQKNTLKKKTTSTKPKQIKLTQQSRQMEETMAEETQFTPSSSTELVEM